MPDKIFDIITDTKNITRLANKFSKYGPVAMQAGIQAVTEYLNSNVLQEMYPPETTGQPFEWTSDRQRRAYFASDGFGSGIPYNRSYELMMQSEFVVDQSSFQGTPYSSISFQSEAPYAKFVIGPDAIIGHLKRGWKPVGKLVITRAKPISNVFKEAVLAAWEKQEEFMYGGGAGL